MSIFAWTVILTITLPLSLLTFVFVSGQSGTAAVQRNLGRGVALTETKMRSGSNVFELGRRLTPDGYVRRLDRLLALAGRPAAMPLPRLLFLKPLAAAAGAGLGLLAFLTDPLPQKILLGIGVAVLGYFVPDLLLRSRGRERQNVLQLELPDVLDQMLISVEAGLGFESATGKAASNGTGPMAAELARTLQDMQMGRSRREAYQDMADRSTVADLRSFVRAVVQADTYGIGIAQVLRVQAGEMRLKRRQRAEERAMKIPVKILFPLLFCILPVLFIVILAPAVLSIVQTFTR